MDDLTTRRSTPAPEVATTHRPIILRSDIATSFVIFGSYFPAWVACLLLGLVAALMGHVLLRGAGMVAAVPLLPVFYLLLVTAGAMGSWLLLFAGG